MYNLEGKEAYTFFVGTQGWLVHNATWCEVYAHKLAQYTKKGQKTEVYLLIGEEETYIVSGRNGLGNEMFKNVRGAPTPNLTINTHVEAHAAAMMRHRFVQEANLYINNMPCTRQLGS